MDKITGTILALLRHIFMGEEFPDEYKKLSEEEGKVLYAVAKRHEIAHMIDYEKIGLLLNENVKAAFNKAKKTAIYCHLLREEEYRKITEILEKEKISYMPLKGSVIKKFYPEEWMRTSTDIDILVHEEDLPEIEKAFTEQLSYTAGAKGKHDVGFMSPTGVSIEMHYKLIDTNKTIDDILHDAWKAATEVKGTKYCYGMPDEMFFLYHLAHMAKHFRNGGCGIRYYIDYFLITKNMNCDEEKFSEMLKATNLNLFKEATEKIVSVWFYGDEKDELAQEIETFVLTGGIHGNAEHHAALKQRGKLKKINYILSRIFVKRETLEGLYPRAKKYPILIPYYYVKRWMKMFNAGHRKRSMTVLKVNLAVTERDVEEANALMKELGI